MKLLAFSLAAIATAGLSQAAIVINSLGDSYSQNFDALGNVDGTSYTFVDNSTISGWYANSEEMDSNSDEYFGDDGAGNGGEVYSYGTGSSTERAFGYLGSGGNDYTNFGLVLNNATGALINTINIGYVGEQWRSGGNTSDNNNVFVFSHQVFAGGAGSMPTSTIQTGWTVTNALEFTAPQPNVAAGALDGNLAANQTSFTNVQITGLNWQDGEDLWIRFAGDDGSGTDAGMAIDDFSVTTVPEPSILGLTGLALSALLIRRRR